MRIVHRVGMKDAALHLVDVETKISSDSPLPQPLELFMAVWTPGSYLVREYSRHVEQVTAEPGHVKKTAKNSWSIEHEGVTEITVRYRLYCNDLTVRTNHADATHVYLNGAPTFMGVRGHTGGPYEVEIDAPQGWNTATSLHAVPQKPGAFRAVSFDELVDSPLEIGSWRELPFTAAGKPHRYAVWPPQSISEKTASQLVKDSETIIATEAKLTGGLPHDGYTFILHLSPRGRGGLEHLASSTLLASESAHDSREGWLDLLSLVAHEYFHLWNVKRIRPSGLFPYHYEQESYTRLLWWFEGATSYYDWRVLKLAGLCTTEEYLDHLASEIAYVEQTPGRRVHSLEEASFDAWIKLYRPDENSSNSTVSYYRKGELVNAMLDLEIRSRSGGKSSTDAVLAALWERFGKTGTPVPEDGMQSVFEETTGCELGDLWASWIHGTAELDCASTFAKAGLAIERQTKGKASIAARLTTSGGRVMVASVARGGAAQKAGLDAGDELVSIAGRRVDGISLDGALAAEEPGNAVDVIVSRDGRTRALSLVLDGARLDKVKLVPRPDETADETALRERWLAKLE